MSFKQVRSRGLTDPRPQGHASSRAAQAPGRQASRGAAGDCDRGRHRFSLARGKAGRGMAVLAVSGALSLAGVIGSAAPPAQAGVSVTLSANAAYLVTGQSVTLTAQAYTGPPTGPDYLQIWDATTGTLLCAGPTGSTCTATESEPVAITHDFVAYVARLDIARSFPPPDIVATSTTVAVTWVPLQRIPRLAPPAYDAARCGLCDQHLHPLFLLVSGHRD
jgi:hypothetical protein